MKLEMELLVLLFWQELFSNKLKNYLIKVKLFYNLGLHPLKISDGFDTAVEIAVKRLEELSE